MIEPTEIVWHYVINIAQQLHPISRLSDYTRTDLTLILLQLLVAAYV